VLEHEKLDNDRLYKQCCQLEEDYEDRLAELHNDHGSLIKSINEAVRLYLASFINRALKQS
jgi:hypothetical protein